MTSLQAQLTDANKLGLKLLACPTAMANLNIVQSDLPEEVNSIMGLAAFLGLARTATVNWYI